MSEPFSIDWHVDCHKNQRASLACKREEMDRLYAEVERDTAALEFYTIQINEAVARGLKKFDPARLMKRKRA